jgi:hypothetical protein
MQKDGSVGDDRAPTYPVYVDNAQFDTRGQLFAQLREALTVNLPDDSERSSILTRLDTLEKAKGYTFLRHYSNFIAGAANHMAVVSPFVPGLTSILIRS